MEITIGVQHSARDLVLESEQSAEEIASTVRTALSKGDKGGILELADSRGKLVIVPVSTLGYVEIGPEEPRRVGFGTL